MSTAKKRIYLNLAENERNGSFKEAAKLYSGKSNTKCEIIMAEPKTTTTPPPLVDTAPLRTCKERE